MTETTRKHSVFGIILVITSLVAVGAILFYILSSSSSVATADSENVNITTASVTSADASGVSSKTDQPPGQTGPSGLPIPRFVSLKRSKVNVRRGPSSEHKIAWVFHFKGLPVEIVAEFEHWRRIRDSDGQEGWIYHSLLAGKRTVSVAPWRKGLAVSLLKKPGKSAAVVANVKAGAIGSVKKCTGRWCQVSLGSYAGWINQAMLWGVYPNEKL